MGNEDGPGGDAGIVTAGESVLADAVSLGNFTVGSDTDGGTVGMLIFGGMPGTASGAVVGEAAVDGIGVGVNCRLGGIRGVIAGVAGAGVVGADGVEVGGPNGLPPGETGVPRLIEGGATSAGLIEAVRLPGAMGGGNVGAAANGADESGAAEVRGIPGSDSPHLGAASMWNPDLGLVAIDT